MADQANKQQPLRKPTVAPKPAVSKPAAPTTGCGCGTPAAKLANPQTGQK